MKGNTPAIGNNSDLFGDISREVNREGAELQAAVLTLDIWFLAFLRRVSTFGYFRFGPVTIDVRLIEDIVQRTTPRETNGNGRSAPIGEDAARFFQRLSEEVRRGNVRRIDELHFLLAFMRTKEGLPGRVFGELGVTPEQVEEYARSGGGEGLEKLYSPEEAAAYLNVHVQTVRTWIRSGRLRARRLAGQRALRITASDLQSLLEPIEGEDIE
jgi:excisionase family DNA binding protein